MHRCPHCTKPGVSILGKLIAAPWAPAECAVCGGKSSEPIGPTQALRGSGFIALAAASWASLAYGTWMYLLICILGLTLGFVAIHAWVPLMPLSGPEARKESGRRTLQVAILMFLALLLAGTGLLL